jgi:hypothetical protein
MDALDSRLDTPSTPVVRTAFGNQDAWDAVCAAIRTPSDPEGFLADVDFVDDPTLRGLGAEQLLALVPEEPEYPDVTLYEYCILVVADEATLASPEMPLLIVDLREERGRRIRMIPSELWGIENNLSLANMEFSSFADSVDADGVFRGIGRNRSGG